MGQRDDLGPPLHAVDADPLGGHASAVFAVAVAAGLEGLDDGALPASLPQPKITS